MGFWLLPLHSMLFPPGLAGTESCPVARPGFPSWDEGQLGHRSILRHLDLYLICASTGLCVEGKEKKITGKIINRLQTKTVHYCSVSTLKRLVLHHRCVDTCRKWCHMGVPAVSAVKDSLFSTG